MSENRLLRRILVPQGKKEDESEENCTTRSFIIYTCHQILLRSNEEKEDGNEEKFIKILWESLKETAHLQ
jgi:hypothetical protein